ncbi:MAG: hypothetical protein PHF86_06200 [Candidatus Nanoarchaeia archaeon]|nr:hypothetical protein [Candidatus Nanoarchaeia archaeon]
MSAFVCETCGKGMNVAYRKNPIGIAPAGRLCYDCAKANGTLPDQATVDLCNVIAEGPPIT